MSRLRHAPICLVLAIWAAATTACTSYARQPAPPAPPQVVPSSPVDSRSNGWGTDPKAVEVVIDADVPAKIEASLVGDRILMCTTTPCITKFPPGAYTVSASVSSPERRGCGVDVQVSAVPTIIRLTLPPPDTIAYCGVTLWAPEDKVIYTGSIR